MSYRIKESILPAKTYGRHEGMGCDFQIGYVIYRQESIPADQQETGKINSHTANIKDKQREYVQAAENYS